MATPSRLHPLSSTKSETSSHKFCSDPIIMNRAGISEVPHCQLLSISIPAGSAIAAAAMPSHHQQTQLQLTGDAWTIPRLSMGESGRVEELERFCDYVARQIGFKGINECPKLEKIAYDYVRKTKGYEEHMFSFFSNEPDPEALCLKLMDELDRCILGYFAFHWRHATFFISQILEADTKPAGKLKSMVMEATRKQRFETVTRNLKMTRMFSTLVEEMKAIRIGPHESDHHNEVMIPAAHCDRSPVLLLMGGGMGAGKSTVLQNKLLKEAFWSKAAAGAVVVEADAFKESDVIYRAISSRGHHNDIIQTAELVHQNSMNAASSLLVTALNEGRDVIMDGTLSWEPFVEQTIAMARDVHLRRYRMGPGYQVAEDGSVVEKYWESVEDVDNASAVEEDGARKPYRIELVGVICDAYLAVVRGIRRAILMGRGVRVKSQLKSHKKFATAFPKYCHLVDNARLYCTNAVALPKLIAWKDGDSSLLVDQSEISWLHKVSQLNEEADNVREMYGGPPSPTAFYSALEPKSVWEDGVLCPSRVATQHQIKSLLQSAQNQA